MYILLAIMYTKFTATGSCENYFNVYAYASWDPDEEPGTARMVCQRTTDQGATWEEVEVAVGESVIQC